METMAAHTAVLKLECSNIQARNRHTPEPVDLFYNNFNGNNSSTITNDVAN